MTTSMQFLILLWCGIIFWSFNFLITFHCACITVISIYGIRNKLIVDTRNATNFMHLKEDVMNQITLGRRATTIFNRFCWNRRTTTIEVLLKGHYHFHHPRPHGWLLFVHSMPLYLPFSITLLPAINKCFQTAMNIMCYTFYSIHKLMQSFK